MDDVLKWFGWGALAGVAAGVVITIEVVLRAVRRGREIHQPHHGDASSINIIGGADGPTAIFMRRKKKQG